MSELRAQAARLKRMLLGRRSEKPADDPNQQQLFGDAPPEATPPGDDDDAGDPKPPRRRRRKRHKGRRPLDKGVPGPGFLTHVITSKYADHLPL